MTLRPYAILLLLVGCGLLFADEPHLSTNQTDEQEEHVVEIDGLSPHKILAATHNLSKNRLVFTVHYLWDPSEKIPSSSRSYIKLNSQEYSLNNCDTLVCGSHNAGKNVIEEHVIDKYSMLGDEREIPGLRNAKWITFGIEGEINGTLWQIEKRLPVTLFPRPIRPPSEHDQTK